MAGRSRSRGSGDFKYRIVVSPDPAKLAALIGGLGKEFEDWRPAWLRLAPHLARGIADNIAGRGSPIGETWATQNQRYVARKLREGKGRIDLVVSGSLVADATKAAPLKMGAKYLTMGTNLPYARAVNFGFTPRGGRGGVKRRAFMGWNDQMKQAALDIMNEHTRELLGKASQRINQLQARKVV